MTKGDDAMIRAKFCYWFVGVAIALCTLFPYLGMFPVTGKCREYWYAPLRAYPIALFALDFSMFSRRPVQ